MSKDRESDDYRARTIWRKVHNLDIKASYNKYIWFVGAHTLSVRRTSNRSS